MKKQTLKLDVDYLSNPYYRDNPSYFTRLRDIVELNPYAYAKRIDEKLSQWVQQSLPQLADERYKLATKLNWIFFGRTDFPACRCCGSSEGYKMKNLRVNQEYKLHCSLKCAYAGSVREERRRRTCRARYGTDCAMNDQAVKAARRRKWIETYGVDHPQKSGLKKKENLARFGNACILHGRDQEIKAAETLLRNYGVDNPSKSNAVRKRQARGYRVGNVTFDSKDEISMALYLADHGVRFVYQPDVQLKYEHEGKTHTYHPDFLVEGRLVEIKGGQFFRPDGTMYCPYRDRAWSDSEYRSVCELFEAKRRCMVENGVRIIRTTSEEFMAVNAYIERAYGKSYLRRFRVGGAKRRTRRVLQEHTINE